MRLAILISGRGSNMLALADYVAQDSVACTIVAVIADREASGMAKASGRDLPTFSVFAADYPNKAAHEAAIIDIIEESKADFIFLAGYMRILSPDFCTRYKNRLFNIHPSLLPKHKGLDTHERVLAAGDTIHGCSVHLVEAGMDEGMVLGQRKVPVFEGDTLCALSKRVLTEEHKLYPALLKALLTVNVHDPALAIEALPGLIRRQAD